MGPSQPAQRSSIPPAAVAGGRRSVTEAGQPGWTMVVVDAATVAVSPELRDVIQVTDRRPASAPASVPDLHRDDKIERYFARSCI